jgi:hypothetical protein
MNGAFDDERQRHHIRFLFWHCYITDKEISLRSGQPPLLVEDYCDLTILRPSEKGQSPESNDNGDEYCSEGMVSRLAWDPRLALIKERACRLIYSPRSGATPDSQLLLRIRELDDELEEWRQSMPCHLRPKLSVPPDYMPIPLGSNVRQGVFRINVQLDYHNVLMAIHSTVRKCGANLSEYEKMPEDLHQVVHSSVDINLEAARSTLHFLKAPIHLLEEDSFQYVHTNESCQSSCFYRTLLPVHHDLR